MGTLTDLTGHREPEAARVARDRAEAAKRANTDFVSRMSHELRTPLNAVLGFAQLLSQRLGDPDIDNQRKYVQHIEQAGWHLLAMSNDVLDLSRVESGQLALQLGTVDLADLRTEVAAMMSPLASRHGVRLCAAVVPPQAAACADAVRLNQVLSNLVSNAIKCNREGGRVGFAVRADGARWPLCVEDTGAGIAPEQLPHLFGPFSRLGRERSGVEGVGIGIGIGRVLTRHLVEQVAGEITLRSSLAAGTTVTVTLPRADGTPALRPAPPAQGADTTPMASCASTSCTALVGWMPSQNR